MQPDRCIGSMHVIRDFLTLVSRGLAAERAPVEPRAAPCRVSSLSTAARLNQ